MDSLCNTQGKKFKFNKIKFLKIINNKVTDSTGGVPGGVPGSVPKNVPESVPENVIEGFIEGMTPAEQRIKEMDELEMKFNGKLQQYGIIYDEYIKEKLVSNIDVSSVTNKTVKFDKKNYYVSGKGIMREIKHGLTKHGCDVPELEITPEQRRKLKMGQPLNKQNLQDGKELFEKCKDEHVINTGIVISNKITHDTAWLDDFGRKHKFTQSDSMHPTCPTGVEKSIDSITYSMISAGPDYGIGDRCKIEKNGTRETFLNELNKDLIDIAIKMKNIVNGVTSETNQDNIKITTQTKSLDAIIKDLNDERIIIKKLEKEIFSLEGNVRDNKYLVDASNMQYIGWGVSLITVIVLGLYTMKK
jgi:hypothetical protein